MMCYKDRWFCPFYEDCAKAHSCDRPLTKDVLDAADMAGLYVQQVTEKPECHEDETKPLA